MKLYVEESDGISELVIVDNAGGSRWFRFRWGDHVTWQDLIEVLQELFPSE